MNFELASKNAGSEEMEMNKKTNKDVAPSGFCLKEQIKATPNPTMNPESADRGNANTIGIGRKSPRHNLAKGPS